MKRTVFNFWLGDSSGVNQIKKKWSKYSDLNVIVGPSNEEHSLLMKEVPYYRKSFNLGKFAFCSDVWRVYVLSKNIGLYIDTSTIVGENFIDFYDEHIKHKSTFFRAVPHVVESGVMFSGVKNNDIFADLFNFYLGNEELNPQSTFSGPFILTRVLWKYENFPLNFDDFRTDKYEIKSIMNIRNKDKVWKTSSGSWGVKKRHENYFDSLKVDGWDHHERNFLSKTERPDIKLRFQRSVLNKSNINVGMIRNNYDIETKKSSLLQLKKDYKKIAYKIKFRELLVWSSLYRLFTLKWLFSS